MAAVIEQMKRDERESRSCINYQNKQEILNEFKNWKKMPVKLEFRYVQIKMAEILHETNKKITSLLVSCCNK